MTASERVHQRMRGPWGYFIAMLIGLAAALPTLGIGFVGDDYLHLLTLEGAPTPATPRDLFCFASGNPDETQPFIQNGPFPWFTDPALKVHFFRPLSALTMYLDTQLFGRTAVAFHAHSILWYAVLLLAAALLFRQTLPGGLGVLALLLFALDEGHLLPVAWWANRNAIVSVALALFGLAAHIRWREKRWSWGLPLSIAGYALGLLGGETALGVLGYYTAYECFAAPGKLRRRAAALVPILALTALYLACYKLAGFGVSGTDTYLDPIGQPGQFLYHAPGRFLALAASQLLAYQVELPLFITAAWTGVIALTVAGLALAYVWKSLSDEERRALKWLLPGAMAAVIPTLAAIPSGRLLLMPSLGAAALLAVLARTAWGRGAGVQARRFQSRSRGPLVAFGGLLILIHLVLAPLIWPVGSYAFRTIGQRASTAIAAIQAGGASPDQTIILLQMPDPFFGVFIPFMRRYEGSARPAAWWTLSADRAPMRITRTGPDTLELDALDGQMTSAGADALLRSNRNPLEAGQVITLDGMVIHVRDTAPQGPTQLQIRLEHNLDDPRYIFLAWQEEGFRRVQMPPTGQTLDIPRGPAFANWALR